MRRRIFRLYGELKFLEAGVAGASGGALSEHLDRLEERANRMHVPIAFAHLLYTLKVHISLVRQRAARAAVCVAPPRAISMLKAYAKWLEALYAPVISNSSFTIWICGQLSQVLLDRPR